MQDTHGVKLLACICAIDRATLPPCATTGRRVVGVCGVHELVSNALILDGEKERTMDLRQIPAAGLRV